MLPNWFTKTFQILELDGELWTKELISKIFKI